MEPPANLVERELSRFGRVIAYTEVNGWGIMVTDNGSYYKEYANYMVWRFNVEDVKNCTDSKKLNDAILHATACRLVRRTIRTSPFTRCWKEEYALEIAKANIEPLRTLPPGTLPLGAP
jgi:hypothetical protein